MSPIKTDLGKPLQAFEDHLIRVSAHVAISKRSGKDERLI
jgi:hypothetical protein